MKHAVVAFALILVPLPVLAQASASIEERSSHVPGERLLHVWPSAHFSKSPRAAERELNLQARAGYRLRSLGSMALWSSLGKAPASDYRVVPEPSVRVHTPGHMRDAGRRLADELNVAARAGFRVHRAADWQNTTTNPRTALGAVILERTPGEAHSCSYDVTRLDSVGDENVPIPAGFEPLPVRLREWVVLERCAGGQALMPVSDEGTALRFASAPTWFATATAQIDEVRRKIDDALAEGCSPVWATFKGAVLWCRAGTHALAGYTVLGLPGSGGVRNATMFRALQTSLNSAAAVGRCVVGGEFIEGTVNDRVGVLILGDAGSPDERCEYRVVVPSGLAERIVTTAVEAGFVPAPRVRVSDGLILERRRSRGSPTKPAPSEPIDAFPLGASIAVRSSDAERVGILVAIDDRTISLQAKQGATVSIERGEATSVSPYVAASERTAHTVTRIGMLIAIPLICGLGAWLFAYHG